MPTERRNLRSNKFNESSPSEPDKQKSKPSAANSKKDTSSSTRSTSSRSRSISKKDPASFSGDMSGDKPRLNGDPAENGINGSEDVEMGEESQNTKKGSKTTKDKDGDDEMTVVVPPSKGSSSPSAPENPTEADRSNGAVDGEIKNESDAQVDPQEKAISGKLNYDSRWAYCPADLLDRNQSEPSITGASS